MRLKTYRTKSVIEGFKLAPGLKDKTLVAIPEAKLPATKEVLCVWIECLDGVMFLRHSDMPKCLAAIPFRDKWGRGSYRLCYFEVKLDHQQLCFEFLKSEEKNDV